MAHTSFHASSTASPRGGCSTGSRFAMAGRILYRNFNNIRVRSFILTGAPLVGIRGWRYCKSRIGA
jgi:hypothetical protein